MADHHDGHDEHHGLGHVIPLRVLFGVFFTLVALTVLTVVAQRAHLGIGVALLIATVKATLVCAFFMHLRYDKLIHTIFFLTAVLFFFLFVGFAVMDSGQYQHDVVWQAQ